MQEPDVRKLLGVYALGVLSPDEERRVHEAALADQELFDMLAEELRLREVLEDEDFRQHLRARLTERNDRPTRNADGVSVGWFRFPKLSFAAWSAALIVLVAVIGVFEARRLSEIGNVQEVRTSNDLIAPHGAVRSSRDAVTDDSLHGAVEPPAVKAEDRSKYSVWDQPNDWTGESFKLVRLRSMERSTDSPKSVELELNLGESVPTTDSDEAPSLVWAPPPQIPWVPQDSDEPTGEISREQTTVEFSVPMDSVVLLRYSDPDGNTIRLYPIEEGNWAQVVADERVKIPIPSLADSIETASNGRGHVLKLFLIPLTPDLEDSGRDPVLRPFAVEWSFEELLQAADQD